MIATHNGLPVYKATVDGDDTGMVVCSFVDEPAIESNFIAFDKQIPITLKIQDEEQRRVVGPVMIPDMLIYRRDVDNTEYYITYPADTIHKMAEKFFATMNVNSVDTDHSFELVDGVILTQAFFKNVEKGINPAGFEDLPDDTLFFEYHILNDDIWEGVKNGTWKGFSLAGTFNVVPAEMNKQKKSHKMSKLNKVREMLQSILAQFERISTDKGLLSFDGDELEVGMSVFIVDEEDNETPAPDGEYKTDEGTVYTIKDGKVEAIEEQDGVQEDETTGDDVQPENQVPENMSDEHENAPASDPEPEKFSLIHRMSVAFESFLEKEDKIRAGLASKGIDGWLVDAGDDFVVVGVWNEESMQDKFWKYSVSWDEEGNAIIGDGEEVKSAFVPVEEDVEKTPVDDENFEDQEPENDSKDETIANLEAEVARLEEENGALKERIKELEEKSAASSATEEFERVNKIEKTGNKRLDNLSRILNA